MAVAGGFGQGSKGTVGLRDEASGFKVWELRLLGCKRLGSRVLDPGVCMGSF